MYEPSKQRPRRTRMRKILFLFLAPFLLPSCEDDMDPEIEESSSGAEDLSDDRGEMTLSQEDAVKTYLAEDEIADRIQESFNHSSAVKDESAAITDEEASFIADTLTEEGVYIERNGKYEKIASDATSRVISSLATERALVASGVTEVAPRASYSRRLYGSIYFQDERIQTSNTTGSRLLSSGRKYLTNIAYYLHAKCGSTIYSSGARYTDDYGLYDYTFQTSCSDPSFRLLVYFFSKYDNKGFHGIYDENDLLRFTYIYDSSSGDWFAPPSFPYWQSVNVSCPHDFNYICTVGSPTYKESSHREANIYQTGIDVAKAWGAYQHTSSNRIHVGWPGRSDGLFGAVGLDGIGAPEWMWYENHSLAHEFGHIYMKRAIGHGSSLASGDCANHSWNYAAGSETCATSEGWANFFAAATYFSPNAEDPYYRFCGNKCGDLSPITLTDCQNNGPLYPRQCTYVYNAWREAEMILEGTTWRYWYSDPNGFLRNCAMEGMGNEYEIEANVARYFWDLYDIPTEDDGTSDDTTLTTDYMLQIWEAFADGYDDRMDLEPYNSSLVFDDLDGRNAVDYLVVECNNIGVHCSFVEEFFLNCLGGQDLY